MQRDHSYVTRDPPYEEPSGRRIRKYGRQPPDPSRLQLALCVLAVCGGAAAAVYLYWVVHWVAVVVIGVYLWILLTDICVTGRESVTWYLLDFLHHLLSFTGTAVIASYVWRIDWRIGTAAILPVLVLLLTLTGFLILRLYDLTPEGRAAREARQTKHEPKRTSLV
jgi:fatty acid desaturase